jgi:hypothetical protein
LVYGGVSGGVARAQNEKRGMVGGMLGGRTTFRDLPMMFELRLEGDLIPGLETARWEVVGAGGFRYRLGPIVPVVFAELGGGRAHQKGGNAFGLLAGIGGGLELALGRWWVALVDVRSRYLSFEDWKRDDKLVEVRFPDTSWSTTTIQLGLSAQF